MKHIRIVGLFSYPDIPEAHRIVQIAIRGGRCYLTYDHESAPLDGVTEVIVFCHDWRYTPTNLILRAKEAGIPLSLFVHQKQET